MTLVVGIYCDNSIIMGAEQQESTGIAAKRNVCKLRRYANANWALGFSGAGEGALIDSAERHLVEWLRTKERFTGNQLANAIEEVLGEVYTKFIDPDPRSEGISLIVGASCEDGLCLIQTHKRAAQFQYDYACSGYGSDVAIYLFDRLHEREDKWIESLKIAIFALSEVKESAQYCGGDSDFLVFQKPPHPRWRKLSSYYVSSMENESQNLIFATIRPKILEQRWRPEMSEDYIDEHHSVPYKEPADEFEPSGMARHKAEIKRLESQDE